MTIIQKRLAWVLGGRTRQCGDELSGLAGKLAAAHPRHRLKLARQAVTALARQMESMSHRNVLARGFSVTRSVAGDILHSVKQVAGGAKVRTELADGKFSSVVEGPAAPKQPRQRRKQDNRSDPKQAGLFDS